MKIYNSLTGKKEILETLEPNRVKMYVCGMTVYDHTHIGHARTFLCFDVIVRYLRHAVLQLTTLEILLMWMTR